MRASTSWLISSFLAACFTEEAPLAHDVEIEVPFPFADPPSVESVPDCLHIQDLDGSLRIRFTAWKILSDGNPMNFLTQQLPT